MSNGNSDTPSSNPIPIVGRHRSASMASSIPALSNSPTSTRPASIQTPTSTFSLRFNSQGQPHHRSASDSSANGGPGGSPTSPLAYFLGAATSPIRSNAPGGFPFNGSKGVGNSAIDEDEESPPGGSTIGLFGIGASARRGSWTQNGTWGSSTAAPAGTAVGTDRGASVLRRLSLSGAFQRPGFNSPTAPAPPPPSAVVSPPSPPIPNLAQPRPGGRKGRSATLNVSDPSKKRGISPMGERLLKGHFDGFI